MPWPVSVSGLKGERLFQAKSVEEKRLWASHIKRLILENHNTIPKTVKVNIGLNNNSIPLTLELLPGNQSPAHLSLSLSL